MITFYDVITHSRTMLAVMVCVELLSTMEPPRGKRNAPIYNLVKSCGVST